GRLDRARTRRRAGAGGGRPACRTRLHSRTLRPRSRRPRTRGQREPALQHDRTPMIRFETSLGSFDIELNDKEAPISAANFLAYVDDGFFDGTLFHRVIPGFMIQGGGMSAGLEQKPTREPIANEAKNGLKNLRGTLSMARTNDIN